MRIMVIISILAVLALALPVSATIINVPADSSTIQGGINGASNGDTVLVAPGTYIENVDFNGTSLVLSSLYLTTGDTSYISSTIINGYSSGAVITVSNGEDSTSMVIGFTIEYGSESGVRVSHADPKITHNIFRFNAASGSGRLKDGGAIYYEYGNAIIAYNEMANNLATQGGAMWIEECSGNIYNNVIYENSATRLGCGILLYRCDTIAVNNNTICFNEAIFDQRGGIYIVHFGTQISIYNNIIAFNSDCGIGQSSNDPSELSIGFNDIFGNTAIGAYYDLPIAPTDLFLNPLFVGVPFLFYLQEDSPCIDTGDPNSPLDPDSTIADIGAFYFQDFVYIPAIVSGIIVDENTAPIESVYVQSSFPYYGAYSDLNGLYELEMGSGMFNITFQKSGYYDYIALDISAVEGDTIDLDVILYPRVPSIINVPGDYPTIQEGINAAIDGDTVLVAPGTYIENVNFNGTSLVLSSQYLTTGDTSYISATIIRADYPTAVIAISNGEDSTSQIIGFTIENGSGSGVRVSHADPKIMHNIFRFNVAVYEGGAIYYEYGNAIIAYNEMANNHATQGGAMWIEECSGNIYNNLIYENSAANVGCGIVLYDCDTITVNNNTICLNEVQSSVPGGGIFVTHLSTQISIFNNILAYNADYGIGHSSGDTSELSIGYNDIFDNSLGPYLGLSPSPSDLFLNPIFAGGDPFLFYLQESSPCINAGDPNSPHDPDGTIADIGAFYLGDFAFIPAIVSGVVVDENNAPIESVYVQSSFPYYSAYSDLNGLYELAMGSETYNITFQKYWYYDYTAYDIIAIEGDTIALDAILYPHSPSIINVPGDYPTIQEGINAAIHGDTVLVAPETYIENVNFNGTNLVLSSLYLTTGDTSYISSTIINGNSSGAVITVSNGEDSTSQIIGFTIEFGSASGVRVSHADPKIMHNIFRNNAASSGYGPNRNGGAIYYEYGNAIIAYNEMANNIAYKGAAMWVEECSGNIFNNLIYNNSCTDRGSGILLFRCDTVIVNNNTICFNEAIDDPRGGLHISRFCTQISIYNNIIAYNVDYGIGKSVVDTLELSIGYNDIFGNTLGAYYDLPISPTDLFLNPIFVGGDPFLFYLQESSPCIDAGDPNSPYDPDSTIADIGAFYFQEFVYIPAVVSGIIVNENTVPIESVYVQSSFPYYGAYSDLSGQYELVMGSGIYDITFQKSEYYDYIAHDINAIEGDTITLDVTLYTIQEPCTSCVRGVVENRESAQIESVYVWAVGTGVDDYTDFIGRYALEGLPEGTYDVSLSHPFYFDTTVTDILVSSDSATTLDLLLEGNGAITGVVIDTSSQPISGVSISVSNLDLSGMTDDYGEYYIDKIIPERAFDVLFTHYYHFDEMLNDILVNANDTLVLDTVVMSPGDYEVIVWYGNPDGSPITAPIGGTKLVDVYVQSADYLNLNYLHLPLGTDDQYIVDHHSIALGVIFPPLTEWDDVQFRPPDELSPGWQSQSLVGYADVGGDPNPFLRCPVPTRIASFALEIVNDSSLIGDTVSCFMEGYNPASGGPLFGDSTGIDPYFPVQFFSDLYLAEPIAGCQYVPGDVNGSGGYNGLDITFAVAYFKGGPAPPFECECTPGDIWYVSGDVNGSCSYNGLDITYGVAYFKGGPAPIPCADCPPVE